MRTMPGNVGPLRQSHCHTRRQGFCSPGDIVTSRLRRVRVDQLLITPSLVEKISPFDHDDNSSNRVISSRDLETANTGVGSKFGVSLRLQELDVPHAYAGNHRVFPCPLRDQRTRSGAHWLRSRRNNSALYRPDLSPNTSCNRSGKETPSCPR